MTFEEFKAIIAERKRTVPSKFALENDRLATRTMIKAAEEALGVKFPLKFTAFLAEFGGGDLGALNIFSADPDSPNYIVSRNADPLISNHRPSDFVVISDDAAGGFYGFRVMSGVGQERIDYWDWETGEFHSSHNDVLEFVIDHA